MWPGTEPARSVLALLEDLLHLVAGGTGSTAEGAVHARRRGSDWLITSAGDRLTASRGAATDCSGPWREVLRTGRPLVVPDLRDPDADVPEGTWRAAAVAAGFRSLVVLPAPFARGGGAALTLWLDEAGGGGPELLRRAGGFAEAITSLIDLHLTIPARDVVSPAEQLGRRTRASVDHAVGVLMEVRGCDEDEARHVLEVLGATQGRTLEAVAASVVRHAVRDPATAAPATGRDTRGYGGSTGKAARRP